MIFLTIFCHIFKGCGLVKNLALMTHITTEVEEEPLARIAFHLGVQDPGMLGGEELYQDGVYMVFLNGTVLGVVRNHERLIRIFRKLRRKCWISSFVSIYSQPKFR